MKLIFIMAIVFSLCNMSCNKGNDLSTLTLEVVDYITGQPIQGATVKRSYSAGFNLSCLCNQTNNADSLGITDINGLLKGMLTLEGIFVEKNGYYSAQEFYYCVHEKTDYLLKFHLFRQSIIKLTSNPSRTYYPEPYVEIGPILKNGSMKSLTDNGNQLPDIRGYVNPRPCAGDMQNRIIVLKRNDGISRIDTLYKEDIFVPANTVIPVTVNY